MYLNQLTVKHGSMVKGYLHIRDYYLFILQQIQAGKSVAEIESDLSAHDKYQILVKERPTLSKKPKEFSQEAKNFLLMQDVLATAFRCNICGARIDKKAMQLDHKEDRSQGGLAQLDNGQWAHPYCNSNKPKLVGKCLPASPVSGGA